MPRLLVARRGRPLGVRQRLRRQRPVVEITLLDGTSRFQR
jgi:hypothetical protein